LINAPKKGCRVLCTWEIGGDLGHISSLSKIAKALAAEGYQVVIALQDLSRAYPFFCDSEVTLLQAPVWLPKISLQRPIACLADTLLLLGYLQVDPLHALVIAWQNLLDLVQPDLIIFDYSPTAMLASLNRPLPKMLIGTGFADPVPGYPIADWRPSPVADGLTERQEARVLEQINAVLARQQQPPLRQLANLFATDRVMIQTFPELDLYRQSRVNAHYCLGASASQNNIPVKFTGAGQPRILAYLKPQYPHMQQLLAALAACNATVFIACPQGNLEQFQAYTGAGFQVSVDLVNLQDAMAEVDLFVCHGNANSVRESLVSGTPLVVLPIQLEQLLTAKRIEECGFGMLLQEIHEVEKTMLLLNKMLDDKQQYRSAIATMLARYPQPRLSLCEAVTTACAELLANEQDEAL